MALSCTCYLVDEEIVSNTSDAWCLDVGHYFLLNSEKSILSGLVYEAIQVAIYVGLRGLMSAAYFSADDA